MAPWLDATLGRRAFLVGSGLAVGCSRTKATTAPRPSVSLDDPTPSAAPALSAEGAPDGGARVAPSTYALFDAFPALAASLPRAPLGHYPSAVAPASALLDAGRLWIKRDDDFTRAGPPASALALTRLFGGNKVRKLELYFGEAQAQGKKRIVTFGGVGSNQALATALFGEALGFSVALYLAPQVVSAVTSRNLAADAASHAEMRLFPSVSAAMAEAAREAARGGDAYVIPPGGTTPLGTLGFVSAGLELAADVAARRLPAPRRVYVALGLGGSAVGLGIGCALGGLTTEIVGVRASNPQTVTEATLRAVHGETIAFARARAPAFPAQRFEDTHLRIDGRFVGPGYGVPTREGDDAVVRARDAERLQLDPVYTGKALAAVLSDARAGETGPLLFWNTVSSRPVALASIPQAFQRYAR